MNLGEGMNSGNRPGCFFNHTSTAMTTHQPRRNGGEDPAGKIRFVLSGGAILTDSHRQLPRKEGKQLDMKIATIAAVAALAIAALGLGACASKPAPAPAPSTIGTSK